MSHYYLLVDFISGVPLSPNLSDQQMSICVVIFLFDLPDLVDIPHLWSVSPRGLCDLIPIIFAFPQAAPR